MLLIFAGNHKQADDFIREHQLDRDKVRYVNTPQKFFGVQNCGWIKTGEWWLNDCYLSSQFHTLQNLGHIKEVNIKDLGKYI